MSLIEQARRALHDRFTGTVDASGYVRRPENNLVPGINLERCAADLERGDGDELRTKFRAVHSSSALAVNSFGVFKSDRMLSTLVLDGVRGATCVEFEKPLRIFRGGRAPNLDVWIERERDIVAFSDAYDRLAPPVSEPCWWTAYQRSRTCGKQLLDRAQLQKHYFGLSAYLRRSGDGRPASLLYLFWEPLNWEDVEECRRHREEVRAFAEEVVEARVAFRWMTYNQLWDVWSGVPELAGHAENLKARYQVRV